MEEEAKPVRQPQRRLNPHMQEVVRAEVLKLLQAGIIYPISDSPWVSPTQVVPKKSGITWCKMIREKKFLHASLQVGVCIDYRKLNVVTRKTTSHCRLLIKCLRGSLAIHSTVSWMATPGYFQIEIDVEDQEKTTFTCPFGTYAYRRMPFGLCNAPATFQRCIQLGSVLNRCIEKDLVLNWEKCHFMVHQGIVLGHIISKQGIEVDKAKVELIVKLPSPTTVKGVRQFLGHAGFYRRFIKDFSKLARPLCELLVKDAKFVWDDRCQRSFEELKLFLTTAPIVRAPNWQLPFEVMCDASDFAIGAVLGQREDGKPYVIYYASKTLNEAQRNYTTTEKELLAVVFALDKFCAYLIKDKKGVENVVADHLSRLAITHNSHSLPINDDFPEESLMLIEVAPWYAHIANYLVTEKFQAPEVPTIPSSDGRVPSNPPQRQYKTWRPPTSPLPESSVHRTPTKRVRTSGPRESSRHSQPDPRAPFNSQRSSGMSPEAIIKRPMVIAPPIQGNSYCRARPFHFELYFDLEVMRQQSELRDSFGLLQRHIAEALHIPYEPVDLADFREWSLVSQLDMVHILSRGTSEDSVLLPPMPEVTYTAPLTTHVVPPAAPSTSEAFITISATEFRVMQHLGLLPPPQPDIPGPSEPIAPAEGTIPTEETTRADVPI
ncbi:Retrovirus-related Pol polyprotein from transposon 17.6 [Vitis vinifera]|uniref:Retrovirus-related Pol polyprotein from transposon 17.6 n=1 Tax=Vitis vinifera TaxID=29760 RepID=A0A438G2F3_VITVI|nr:Retrovirus-related Pol polyprotein from transposon 17.6 [Vitis vinifera]